MNKRQTKKYWKHQYDNAWSYAAQVRCVQNHYRSMGKSVFVTSAKKVGDNYWEPKEIPITSYEHYYYIIEEPPQALHAQHRRTRT